MPEGKVQRQWSQAFLSVVPVTRPESVCATWNTGCALWTSGNAFSLWGWLKSGVVSILRDTQKPPGHTSEHLALDGSAWAVRLDWMTSRDLFQFQQFCEVLYSWFWLKAKKSLNTVVFQRDLHPQWRTWEILLLFKVRIKQNSHMCVCMSESSYVHVYMKSLYLHWREEIIVNCMPPIRWRLS